jgi:glycerophosphoryl diester phosphodiesterase
MTVVPTHVRRTFGRGCVVAAWLGGAAAGCVDPERPVGWPDGALDGTSGQKVSYFDTPRPWIIGHRGTGEDAGGETHGEDTVPALTYAILEEGAVGVEFDVTLTKDMRVVVMHDPTLERTTDCGGCVWEMTLEEIQQCNASGSIPGVHPPALQEVLEALGSLPVSPLIMIDTKVGDGGSCVPPVAEDAMHGELGRRIGSEVHAAGLGQWSAVQGYPPLLEGVRTEAPEMGLLLVGDVMQGVVDDASRLGFTGLAVGLERLDREPVEAARQKGLLIDTFVVDAPSDLSIAVLYGVDVIETDRVQDILAAFE